MTHHHQQGLCCIAEQSVESRQEHAAVSRPWRMDEHGCGSISGFEKHTVGSASAL
jgi:hypothetical protein